MTSTATSSEQTGTHKRLVRNYLLDSHFQLKYAGFLVAVAIAITGVVGAVLYATMRAMVTESANVVEESRKAADESRKVSSVSRMNVRDLAADSPDLVARFNTEASAYDRVIAEHEKAVVAQQNSLIQQQGSMIEWLIGGLTLMVALIGLLGIYFTHKVAGPIFKMKRLLTQVGRGNLQVDAHLRKGDELKDFFDTFTQMVSSLRAREERRLAEIDAAIGALDRGNEGDASGSLHRLRKAIRDNMGE